MLTRGVGLLMRACSWKRGVFCLGLVFVLGGVSPAQAGPVEALQAELREILDAPELAKAVTGIHVRRLRDDRTLFAQNARKLFNPASNMKLLTTAAALRYLGPNYHFRTRVYHDGDFKNGRIDGDLYVVGGGDPLLTTENLFGMVNDLAMRGLREVRGDIVVDESFFDGVIEGPGWEQETSDFAYAAPIAALSVNFNSVELRVRPGESRRRPVRWEIWPPVSSVTVENNAKTRGAHSRSRLWVGTSKTEDNGVVISLRGSMHLGESHRVYRRRIHDPARFAGEAFKAVMQMRGIRVRGKLRVGVLPKSKVEHLSTHVSKPLAELVSTLNKYSNNFMAEMILKTTAAEIEGKPGTWQKGSQILTQLLSDVGVPEKSYVVKNGSGLNDVNRITPEQITFLLSRMYRQVELGPEFVSSLAVAGVSGTINERFENTPASHRLRAKTGTLSGVSALSGYVSDQSNEVIAFSIMMNDYPGRARSMWQVQERIGVALARFGAAPHVASTEP